MQPRFYKYFMRNISLVAPAVAALASIAAMSYFVLETSKALPLVSGTLASVVGGAIAYALAMAYKAASREVPAVFISYSHGDAEFAGKVSKALADLDVEPILDRLELKVGDDIRAAVDEMIDRSDYFLFIISGNSANSDWAKKEMEQAIKREKRILPVVLDAEAIPEPLSGIYYADFTGDFEAGIDQLKRTLQGKRDNPLLQRAR